MPTTDWVTICGRRVKLYAREKSQTVNICTVANAEGEYELSFRFPADSSVSPAELRGQGFADLDVLAEYLKRRGGTPEGAKSARARRAGVAMNDTAAVLAPTPSLDEMKGSQRRICEWVNDHPDELDAALAGWSSLQARRAAVPLTWLCPLPPAYREIRDTLWHAAGLPGLSPHAAGWWPSRGPRWDAVARVPLRAGNHGVLLVEAKSHTGELRSSPTGAGGDRRNRILDSLSEVKQHLGVADTVDWAGRYYQMANRLAFLYYLRRSGIESWLASVYFIGDEFGDATARHFPATEAGWQPALEAAARALGLPDRHPLSDRTASLFLPSQPHFPHVDPRAGVDPSAVNQATTRGCRDPAHVRPSA